MQPCPGNLVAIGHMVVYYAWAAHAFSAGIKYRHCVIAYLHATKPCIFVILVLGLYFSKFSTHICFTVVV